MSKDFKDECNITVAVRFRPFSKDEKVYNGNPPFKCNRFTNEVVTTPLKGESVTYDFDNVFAPSTKQEEIFHKIAQPVIDDMLLGFNCTIFAYGQTGTGKTYTMEGNLDNVDDHGIIPRSITYIFDRLHSYNPDQYHVKISFLEIYNEELYDLLDDDNTKKLKIHEDSNQGATCRNQTEIVSEDINTIFSIMHTALKRRKTAETNLNVNSSRSHCIFSISVELIVIEGNREYIRNGKLNLVDLAGSECIGRSGAINKRAREAGNINQSLLVLARVIMALVDNNKYIPYRDSKLTHLLKESLGGKAKTCIIATCSPSNICFEETENTLKYAYNAKHIKNKPSKNMIVTQASVIKELQLENEDLKNKLSQNWENNGINISYTEYETMSKKVQEERAARLKLETELLDLNQRYDQVSYDNYKKDKLLEAHKLYIEGMENEKHELLNIIQNTEHVISSITENKKQKDIDVYTHNNTLVQSIQQEVNSLSSLLQSYINSNISSLKPLQECIQTCLNTTEQNSSSVMTLLGTIQELYTKIIGINKSQIDTCNSINRNTMNECQVLTTNSNNSIISLLESYNNEMNKAIQQLYDMEHNNTTQITTSFSEIQGLVDTYNNTFVDKSNVINTLLVSYSTTLQSTITKYLSQLADQKKEYLSNSEESKRYLENKSKEYLSALKTLGENFISLYNKEYVNVSNHYQSFLVEQENHFQTVMDSNQLLLSEYQSQFKNVHDLLHEDFHTIENKINTTKDYLSSLTTKPCDDTFTSIMNKYKETTTTYTNTIQSNFDTIQKKNHEALNMNVSDNNKKIQPLYQDVLSNSNHVNSILTASKDTIKQSVEEHQALLSTYQNDITSNYTNIDNQCKLLSNNIHSYIQTNMQPSASTELTPLKKSFNIETILNNDKELHCKFQAIEKSIEDESISKKQKLDNSGKPISNVDDDDFFN